MEALTRYLDQRISGSPDSVALEAGIFFKAFWGLFSARSACAYAEFLPLCCAWGCSRCSFFFVFTFILPRMGNGNPMAVGGGVDFGTILLPGLMAVAIMFSGIAGVALPLSSEFGITRRLDDSGDVPSAAVDRGSRKVCFSAMQSIVAALAGDSHGPLHSGRPVRADIQNWFLLALVLCWRVCWQGRWAWSSVRQ